MSYTVKELQKADTAKFIKVSRLMIGLSFLLIGVYFALSSGGLTGSLGIIAVMASPFVMVIED